MKRVLVLCTGNSCRSQIAEGYLRHFAGNKAEIYSAGVEIHGVSPSAIKVMKEDGIDISGHTSNHIDEYRNIDFDFVITVCDHARESCPFFLGRALNFHHNFPDPAKATGTEAEILEQFRNIRQLIKGTRKSLQLNICRQLKASRSSPPAVCIPAGGVFASVNYHIRNLPPGTLVRSPKDAHTG